MAGARPAGGDQPAETLPAFRPDGVFDARGIDNVDLFSGDTGVVIPLGPEYLLGPTTRWQLKAYNTAKFWHYSQGCINDPTARFAYVSGDPTLGVGWTLRPGYVERFDPFDANSRWLYWGPDGTPHQVDLSVSNPAVTKDGSHLRIKAIPNAGSPTSYTVEFPDGSIQTFGHSFTAPGGPFDFRTWDYSANTPTRFGLTEVDDPFGNKVLEVTYDASHPAEFTSIKLATTAFPSSPPTLTFTWTNFTVNASTWRVLSYALLPTPGGTQLKVAFTYQVPIPGSGTGFLRNNFDLPSQSCTNPPSSPTTADVPELSQVQFTDSPTAGVITSTFSYFFSYYQAPSGDPIPIQKQGTIQTVTLPSQQTSQSSALPSITYDYGITGGLKQISPSCDPYTCSTSTPESFLLPGNIAHYSTYLDKTPAVKSRAEFDPFTNRTATITYSRGGFFVYDTQTGTADTQTFVRRVTVTRPGNDDGLGGAVQYATQHFFHAAFNDDTHPEDQSGGIEMERRYFDNSDPLTANLVRNLIMCWGTSTPPSVCGFKDSSGNTKRIGLTDRNPPSAEVTWFGTRPSTQDGGTCSASYTPSCTNVSNTNYNSVAGHYDDSNTSSTLPGPGGVNINRSVETNWLATSQTQTDWFLDLYDHKFVWDGAGSCPPNLCPPTPASSDGATVVRQYFDFDSTNGFLKGSWTWDSIAGKAIKNCRYNGGSGVVSGEYSQTYTSVSEPTATACPGSLPSIPTDSDTFGKAHTWTNLLLTQSNWQTGTSTIGWNSFDVTRDTNTGLITTARDPNATLTTTYTYDALGRILKIQPPGGSSVEWPTTMCYLPTIISGATTYTSFIIVKKTTMSPTLGPGGTACVKDEGVPSTSSGSFEGYQYDGLGRLIREIRRVNHALSTGSYFAVRDSRYDSAGHRTFFSDWQPCSTGTFGATSISSCSLPQVVNPFAQPGPTTQYINFDPFGRTQQFASVNGGNFANDIFIDRTDDRVSPSISFSDSKEKVTMLCVNGTWSGGTCSGGVSSVTLTEKDALGRVTKVTEPDPVTGNPSTDVTSYTYNVLDKIYVVTQGAQTRTFLYQAFGFLKSEQTPEDGVGGNATAGYSLYGSIGNLRTKTDGNPISTQYNYTYDPAGRLTLLTTGTVSPFPEYLVNCYDGTAACGDSLVLNFGGGTYPKGRLTRRVGWNQVGFPAAPVFDDFTYGDSGNVLCPSTDTSGRLCAQTTSVGSRGTGGSRDLTKAGFGAPVIQHWTYNSQGLVATHIHPRVSGASTSLTINDLEYTSGLLTKVTASGSTSQQLVTANYHESGRLSDYTTSSPTTIKTTISADGVIPSRPGQISSSVGGFSTGTYAYDGAGNIKSMGSSDTFLYDARSRITQAKYGTPLQGFSYDRYGNMWSKAGTTLCATHTCTNNRLDGATHDDRGNMTGFSTEGLTFDLLNREYRNIVGTSTDFTYLYDGAGERVGKFPTKLGATRREFARIIIEGRGDSPLSCTPDPFLDVTCAANPNDGKYVQKMKDIAITSGCGGGNYCPDAQTQRDQASVFFLKGEHCALNVIGCTYAPPDCHTTHTFTDVTCPSQYADWVGELYAEGITVGCDQTNNKFCPTDALGSWQALAWAQKIWPTYYPLPRVTILTFRDEKGRVVTESQQKVSTGGDDTGTVAYARDNAFLGNLLVSSVVWSGANWTTPGWQFYSSDHLGSPRLTTDTSAATVETKKYWPYGDEASSTGNAIQRLKFATMERDDETNHFYDHARTHDFNLGRFVSPDILGERGVILNRYSYSRNNPLRYGDSDGLETSVYIIGPGPITKPGEWGGHAMLSVTAGDRAGYISQTLSAHAFRTGSPDAELGHYLDEGRRVKVIQLNTSPEVDRALYNYISTATFGSYSLLHRNCSQSVCRSLANVGFPLRNPETDGSAWGSLSPAGLGSLLMKSTYVVSIATYTGHLDLFGNYVASLTLETRTNSEYALQLPAWDSRRWAVNLRSLLDDPRVMIDGVSFAPR